MTTFTDAEYMTANEKALVLKQWNTFLKRLAVADQSPTTGSDYGYFPSSLDHVFPDRLYKHLSLHCGFIAHYDRRGFLSARFGDDESMLETFATIRNRPYMREYEDIRLAMVDSIRSLDSLFVARLERSKELEKQSDLRQLARLKSKYPEAQ